MGYQLTMPTAFEQQVRTLGLNERTCVASKELRQWCERNKNQCYIPEWLLKQWGMFVDTDLTQSQGAESFTRLSPPDGRHGPRRWQASPTVPQSASETKPD